MSVGEGDTSFDVMSDGVDIVEVSVELDAYRELVSSPVRRAVKVPEAYGQSVPCPDCWCDSGLPAGADVADRQGGALTWPGTGSPPKSKPQLTLVAFVEAALAAACDDAGDRFNNSVEFEPPTGPMRTAPVRTHPDIPAE